MTPDPLTTEAEIYSAVPSTAGMTTKVVKGSIWTLGGQVLPMAVSLFTTPFVIRFLGSEQYGVLILVGLIPSYFTFADLGMGIASTKFASGAYAAGNETKESEIVVTATLIALLSSSIIALPMFMFSGRIIAALNVPESLQETASTALKITAFTFVLTVLSSVLNTPQLSRLRMDLNTAIGMVPRILYTLALPLILYLGFGIIGAVTGLLVAGIATVLAHILVSGRLQPKLFHVRFNKDFAKLLLKFAVGWLFASIAAILLVNTEKLTLTRMVSVRSLAYYSVAFMFANLATTFTGAMLQSLLPAFSQLLGPGKKNEYERLFTRSMRFNLAWLLPTLMLMTILARPFFTLWAGEEFGRESTLPFYVLIAGLFFNILAFIPHGTILASGRTATLAKLYWMELIIYVPSVLALVYFLGILGAAAAWSGRVMLDMFLIIWLAKRNEGVTFEFLSRAPVLLAASVILTIPIAIALLYDNYSLYLIPAVLFSMATYSAIVWSWFLESDERERFRSVMRNLRYRFAF